MRTASRLLPPLLLLALRATPSAATAALYGPDSPVVTLRPYQLDSIRAEPGRTWVLEAYASWCGHCQAFAPTYQALAANLSEWSDAVQVGGIDCAIYMNACLGLGVSGFPTVFVWDASSFDAASAGPSVIRTAVAMADAPDGPGLSQDGAPMHVGGFDSVDDVLTWVLPKIPALYGTAEGAPGARALLERAAARGRTPVAFWPLSPGGLDAQRLAFDLHGRAALALVPEPDSAGGRGALSALGLPEASALGGPPPSPAPAPSGRRRSRSRDPPTPSPPPGPPPSIVVIRPERPRPPDGAPTADGPPPPPPPPYERYAGKYSSVAAVEAWLDARVRPAPEPVNASEPADADADADGASDSAAAAAAEPIPNGGIDRWSHVSLDDLCAAVTYAFTHEVPFAIVGAGPGGLIPELETALLEWMRALAFYFPSKGGRAAVGRLRSRLLGALGRAEEEGEGGGGGAPRRANVTYPLWRNLTAGFELSARTPDDGAPTARSAPPPAESESETAAFRQCAGSQPWLRGFPCSLWLTFHTLQMNTRQEDSARTLTAIHGYAVHFFSCLECRLHFAMMAGNMTDQIAEGIPHQTGVLIMWGMHNAVNRRLNATGGTSNDPHHPKLQWPQPAQCPGCVDPEKGEWVERPLLQFLQGFYCAVGHGFECEAGEVPPRAGGLYPYGPGIGGLNGSTRGLLLGGAFALLMCLLAVLPWACKGQCAKMAKALDKAADEHSAAQGAGGAVGYVSMVDDDEEARPEQPPADAPAARRAEPPAAALAAAEPPPPGAPPAPAPPQPAAEPPTGAPLPTSGADGAAKFDTLL